MERLTTTSDKGGLAFTFDLDITCAPSEIQKIKALGEKLKKYEDAEEQGLLIKLPCKVGDKVFVPTRNYISEYVIRGINIYGVGKHFLFFWNCVSGIYTRGNHFNMNGFYEGAIGTEVFFTKSEAEQALKEMEAEN